LTRVSVVIPAYNEAASIRTTVEAVSEALARLRPRYDCELIVVDDCSRDATAAILDDCAREHPIVVVRHAENRGCAAALLSGAAVATGSTLVAFDADLSYAPPIIEELLDALTDAGAAMALASPYMPGGRVSNVPFTRAMLSRYANVMLECVSPAKVATYTGMVRAYDAAAFRRLVGSGVAGEFNATLVARALRAGELIVEVPAHLAWPEHRRAAAGRMSTRRLATRIADVLRSATALLGYKTFARDTDIAPGAVAEAPVAMTAGITTLR
jgi:glycosyltransferase involved in cell wall biosynthesis